MALRQVRHPDEDEARCPDCGSLAMQIITSPAYTFADGTTMPATQHFRCRDCAINATVERMEAA